jgi:hypothetical protein
MAEQVRIAYQILFNAHAYAYKLKKEEIVSKLASVLGTSKDDKVLPAVASTFMELCKLADFEGQPPEETSETEEVALAPKIATGLKTGAMPKLAISYTINLNLPATTDPKVFDAIFKALKEYLLQ